MQRAICDNSVIFGEKTLSWNRSLPNRHVHSPRPTLRRLSITNRPGDLVLRVGPRDKPAPFWQKCFGDRSEAGSSHDLDRGPTIPNEVSEGQAVHGTGHLDIGENEVNVMALLEHRNSLVRVARLNDLEASFADGL